MDWWVYVLGVVVFVAILGIIVLIHEGGHFIMAKRAGILCHEFSIGMGPVLFQKKIGETVYSIRAIPIGGFVSMAGEEVNFDALKDVKKVKLILDEENRIKGIIADVDNPKYDNMVLYNVESYDIIGTKEELPGELYMEVSADEVHERYEVLRDAMMYFPKKQMAQIAPHNRNFSNKTLLQRFLAVFAGPAMNFVLAIVLFFVLGITRGYPNEATTAVDKFEGNEPIYIVTESEFGKGNGISEGDKIITVGGVPVLKYDEITEVLNSFAMKGEYVEKKSDDTEVTHKYGNYIPIEYLDKSENYKGKTVYVVPNTYIYSIELMFDNPQQAALKNNEAFKFTEANLTKPLVGEFVKNNDRTKAYKAGLRKGDLITGFAILDYTNANKKLNAEEAAKLEFTEVDSINDMLTAFRALEEAKYVYIRYEREGSVGYSEGIESFAKPVLDANDITQIKLQLGFSPDYKFDFLKLLYMPFVETFGSVANIFKSLGLLFNPVAKVGIDDFSSIIGIYDLITMSISEGFNQVIFIFAFLSVNIGFVNLLPLPALDGGRIIFLFIELITRKRPSPKVENIIHTVGLFALYGLMGFIIINEILRYTGIL